MIRRSVSELEPFLLLGKKFHPQIFSKCFLKQFFQLFSYSFQLFDLKTPPSRYFQIPSNFCFINFLPRRKPEELRLICGFSSVFCLTLGRKISFPHLEEFSDPKIFPSPISKLTTGEAPGTYPSPINHVSGQIRAKKKFSPKIFTSVFRGSFFNFSPKPLGFLT